MQGNTNVAYCHAASEPVAYRLVSIVTSTKKDFRTAAERQRDAATGVLELVCS